MARQVCSSCMEGCRVGIELLEEALVLDAKRPEALYGLAAAHAEAGRVRQAVVMYEMMLLVCPSCAESHNNLGVLHRGLGHADKSLRSFLAALQLRPNFPEALNNVAIVLTAQVNPPQLAKFLGRAHPHVMLCDAKHWWESADTCL